MHINILDICYATYHVTDTHRKKSRSLVGYKPSVYITEDGKIESKIKSSNSKVTNELEPIKITSELNRSKYM